MLSMPLSSKDLGELMGRTASSVKQARAKRGIPNVDPRPRLHPSVGPRGTAKYRAVTWAQWQMRQGNPVPFPEYLGLRALAWTCEGCGQLRTCPDDSLRVDSEIKKCAECSRRHSSAYSKRMRETGEEKFMKRARAHAAANRDRHQKETVQGATRSGMNWTGIELELVARSDLSARDIAHMTGRTLYAVKHMRRAVKNDPRKARLADLSTETAELAKPGTINIRVLDQLRS